MTKKINKEESDEESIPKKDQLLSKLGWFVVSKFKSYMLSLDTGDKIELLYLDSTKFDRFPIVRTCPAIKNWSTYLMKQRQESELKHRVLGLLDLHVEWTEAEVQDTEGFIGSLEISKKEVCGYTAFKHEAHQVQSESHKILSDLM
nr:ELM2 domain-containing protein [Tanacetum cinerariifolium]